jgi:integrase
MEPFAVEPRAGFMTLDQARAKAAEYAALHGLTESRDVRAYLAERERAAQAAEAVRAERERAAAEAQRVYNLRALAAEYVATLERRDKHRSALDAANIFKNHLNKKTVADRPAKDVERAEVTALLRELVEAGKGRQAGKLRSYLRAAYGLALRAEGDASAPAALIAFNVKANPVADTRALSEFNKVRDRTLNEAELYAYWTRLADVPSAPVRGALQLALLLGGQRIAQLLRIKRADIDLPAGLLILRDPKGKRMQPRIHELPITPQAKAILQPLVARAAAMDPPSDWVFTSSGTAPVDPSTLSAAARDIAKAMRKAKESRAPFMLADIRRTAETMLAGMRVSSDVSANSIARPRGRAGSSL